MCLFLDFEDVEALPFPLFPRVVAGDVSGRVYDGEDPALIDVDYTDEATAVTVHFAGFRSSRCGGLSHFQWAVGEGWEGEQRESLMTFTDRGIVVVDAASGGGYAQVCCMCMVYSSIWCFCL